MDEMGELGKVGQEPKETIVYLKDPAAGNNDNTIIIIVAIAGGTFVISLVIIIVACKLCGQKADRSKAYQMNETKGTEGQKSATQVDLSKISNPPMETEQSQQKPMGSIT